MKQLAALFFGVMTFAAQALAANFPEKTIKIIVPFTAGGIADSAVRIIAEPLSEKYGQPVIVENPTGAGGSIGTERAARATSDGHTLLLTSPGFAVNKNLIKNLSWDPIQDFDAISMLGLAPSYFVVSSELGVNSMQEYIDYAKENDSGITYASGGLGSSNHLAGLLLEHLADIELEQVLYRGQPDAISDLIAGRVDSMPLTSALSHHIKSGELKALAVTSKERSLAFPNVPTVKEATGLDYETNLWLGLVAPKGVDEAILNQLAQDINAILEMPETKEKFQNLGLETQIQSPEQFKEFIENESNLWSELFQKAGIEPQ